MSFGDWVSKFFDILELIEVVIRKKKQQKCSFIEES
jgi:hypothetical protein